MVVYCLANEQPVSKHTPQTLTSHTHTHTQDLIVDNWVALTGLFGLPCPQLTERKRKQNIETTFQYSKRQDNQISIKSEYKRINNTVNISQD